MYWIHNLRYKLEPEELLGSHRKRIQQLMLLYSFTSSAKVGVPENNN